MSVLDSRQLAIAFGRQLKHHRRAAGLTQHELGERAGHNRSHIADLENGRYVPTLSTAYVLACALSVPLSTLAPDDLWPVAPLPSVSRD
ncbi:helix-turn-helix transcriptional regulator [Dactylosporangium sp. AC04546]|uniref:helix-turn-helix transcriptional regulator n=1 Tax=Dactylosporangium sp. AC04546 TaxID=2862460 RepID=UPI003FA46DD1